MRSSIQRWFGRSLLGIRGVNRADALLGALLSAGAIGLVSGVVHTGHPHGGFWASVFVLMLTAPVIWRRRAPVGAAATMAVGALANGLIIGSMVRCGAALPALALVAFSVGLRCQARRSYEGAALCVTTVVFLGLFDPNLKAVFGIPGSVLVLALWAVGRLARSRERMVAALRLRNRELSEQRERTAWLAVKADRARVAVDLDGLLRVRVATMAEQAAAGRGAVDDEPQVARARFSTIEHEGRSTLAQMREIVGSLREDAPVGPQPGLADLHRLLEHATTAQVRMTVDGASRRLPAGLELSGYRIVEHLVEALQDSPQARVDVALRFEPDVLEIAVLGPQRADVDADAAVAGAREWAALHGGKLERLTAAGRSRTTVRLPLVAAYA